MITKIYAFDAKRNVCPFGRHNSKPEYSVPQRHFTQNIQINFKGEPAQKPACGPADKNAIETAQKANIKPAPDIHKLPYDVALAYESARDMLQNISETTKEAMQTGIEAQKTLKEARGKVKTAASSYKGKIPAKISLPNEDGSEDVLFFTNGILSAYRKNEKKEGEKTYIDKILVLNNGKLVSYKEGVVTSPNKGSARRDVEMAKSLEYSGISVIYNEGFKNFLGHPVETKKTMHLVFGKPWYLEEGITKKLKEKPETIKRRLEFSNKEKTTYSYQENIETFDGIKFIKKALYVEDSVPYRYCEDESFTKSSFDAFSPYEAKKLLCFINGAWHSKPVY